jgi:hypothetical protein
MLGFLRRKRQREELDWYHQTYRTQTGFYEGFGSYQLQTLDGGRNWYALERDGDQVKVLGPVEEIHPGLMRRLEAMDQLLELYKESGPLDLSRPEHREVLEAVGFEIKTK